MIEYIVIPLAALTGSCLTLFSGFGLGTMLVPVFGLFFPIELAIALTAVVHFLNNVFKLILMGKKAHLNTVIWFGLPSIVFAFLGALLLSHLSALTVAYHYQLAGHTFVITPVKSIISCFLLLFVLVDVLPGLKKRQFSPQYLPLGGALSGFFGGLSGNQGALRSAFLLKLNLPKETFVATGVVIACLIDVPRLIVYSKQLVAVRAQLDYVLLTMATLAAFLGVFIGSKLLTKVTVATIQRLVTVFLVLFSVLLMIGFI